MAGAATGAGQLPTPEPPGEFFPVSTEASSSRNSQSESAAAAIARGRAAYTDSRLDEALQAGVSQYGMQTFDQSLYDLYQQGLITYETALENASKPDDFKLRVQGIGSTADSAREQME